MDGLTVISEEQRTYRRAVAYRLAEVANGRPYIGWAAVSMSWVAAQDARRAKACSVQEPGSAAYRLRVSPGSEIMSMLS
jgi:hypothetical protein